MALLLYFHGNFQSSLTAHGTTKSFVKELERIAELPEEKRWITFKTFEPESKSGGNDALEITVLNPAVSLSHVIEEDDKSLAERILEQKRAAEMRRAQANRGLVDLPRISH